MDHQTDHPRTDYEHRALGSVNSDLSPRESFAVLAHGRDDRIDMWRSAGFEKARAMWKMSHNDELESLDEHPGFDWDDLSWTFEAEVPEDNGFRQNQHNEDPYGPQTLHTKVTLETEDAQADTPLRKYAERFLWDWFQNTDLHIHNVQAATNLSGREFLTYILSETLTESEIQIVCQHILPEPISIGSIRSYKHRAREEIETARKTAVLGMEPSMLVDPWSSDDGYSGVER